MDAQGQQWQAASPFDERMTSSTASIRRRRARWFALLVMMVLAGVLGMHALGPGGAPATHRDAGHQIVAVAPAAGAHHANAGCTHTDDGSAHLHHADGLCAAAGIGSAYAPPALSAALPDASTASALIQGALAWTADSRTPPDLSELQLLRI
jgi:hypothetical protein